MMKPGWSSLFGACLLIAISAGDAPAKSPPLGTGHPQGASVPDVVPPIAEQTEAADPQPQLASDRVPKVDVVALVQWEGEQPSVQLLDAETGATLARQPTGYRPTVVLRRSTNELLLSHRIDGYHVLDVLNASNGLGLTRRYPTPDRPVATLGSPTEWATLSRDERYYAYSKTTMRRELPECAGNGLDGPSCTRTTVFILDLEDPRVPPFTYELPRYCGSGSFGPRDASGITVSCNDGRLFHFSPSAPLATNGGTSPRFVTDQVVARNALTDYFTVESEDDWNGAMLRQGSFVWTLPGHKELNYRAVPDGTMPRYPIWAEVGDGRLVVGYIARYYDQYPEGLAVFNMTTGAIERTLDDFNIGRTMIASGPDTLLAITRDGWLIKIDLLTETATNLRKLGEDFEAFALVR